MGGGHAAPQAHGTKAVNPVAPATHRVCFQVVDDEDKPLAGIELRLQHLGKDVAQKTDDKGRVWLKKLRAGEFKVLAVSCDRKAYEFVSHKAEALPGAGAPAGGT